MVSQEIGAGGLVGLDWEAWFSIAGGIAMLGWSVLILAPRRWPWLTHLPTRVLPVLLSGGYAVLILLFFGAGEGGFSSLEQVSLLFSQDSLLLAGWIHYLAFDLFVGGWIAERADRIGLHRVLQAPILFATFMLGPIGFLLYLGLEQAMQRLATGRNGEVLS